MKKIIAFIFLLCFCYSTIVAQESTPQFSQSMVNTQPPGQPVRNMAQWEEVQALTITWTAYQSVLKEIVRAARLEARLYIVCGNQCTGSTDSTSVKNYLLQPPAVSLSNVYFVNAPCNTVWTRDYSSNSCYTNDVDSLLLVDWKYNRPRPKDDTLPRIMSKVLNIPLYETTQGANLLVNTGGNYMTDGLSTAFASKLILTDNSSKTESEIDTIMKNFMGINRYIKMTSLPYDGIHHIDMHMKLLNEETLLVGQYPSGISDGPQIEANLQYVLSGFNSAFGSPYKVIRIPQPPDQANNYKYPGSGGNYLTYTNSTIINKTIIVPQYYTEYDTTALRIWKGAMPGYNVVGINSNPTIGAGGSLHCITHSVGVKDPLLIVHRNLPNTTNTTLPYRVDARVQHKKGIQYATLYFTTDTTQSYTAIGMTLTNAAKHTWTGYIPAQPPGTRVFYYIKGHSNSGKEQVRPMPAPKGNFEFLVSGITTGIDVVENYFALKPAYPNPSKGITCIPAVFSRDTKGRVCLTDMLGKEVEIIYEGEMPEGEKNFFINSTNINAGAYLITIETPEGRSTQKLMVR